MDALMLPVSPSQRESLTATSKSQRLEENALFKWLIQSQSNVFSHLFFKAFD